MCDGKSITEQPFDSQWFCTTENIQNKPWGTRKIGITDEGFPIKVEDIQERIDLGLLRFR